ncbi:hypothetical protein BJ508DRAFT_97221 [Ascobolus immersus RN42]|uniref:Uncharacterized protein n=1 Tax=Ascobolus immersus RN42 TaxID=1160509 RepID=A0A3N4ISK9_ASCIM|nr:hypothetical protein BJ508DRAFT_97221 [Ascobolus immersus RN42]
MAKKIGHHRSLVASKSFPGIWPVADTSHSASVRVLNRSGVDFGRAFAVVIILKVVAQRHSIVILPNRHTVAVAVIGNNEHEHPEKTSQCSVFVVGASSSRQCRELAVLSSAGRSGRDEALGGRSSQEGIVGTSGRQGKNWRWRRKHIDRRWYLCYRRKRSESRGRGWKL